MKRSLYILTVIALVLSGCKKPGPTATERIATFLVSGWAAFEASLYSEALQDFDDVLALEEGNVEAKVGAGWSLVMMDDGRLDSAAALLDSTVTADADWRQDAWAGLATIRLSQQVYAQADSLAGLTLAQDSSYVFAQNANYGFSPDSTIDWHDLLVYQAQARFAQSLYDAAWLAVVPLLSEVSGSPFDGVLRNDPTTWTSAGVTYTYFTEILALAISYFSELYR